MDGLVSGAYLAGLDPEGPVQIISAIPVVDGAFLLHYRDLHGRKHEQVLYAAEMETLRLTEQKSFFDYTADAKAFRLVSEAYRIKSAHHFDRYMAVHSSSIQALPHQIAAVYQEMLPRLPLRFVLADDPGAGKTIMTGLLIKELAMRGVLNSCLIVTPGSLSEQWQAELEEKFALDFEVLENERIRSAGTGPLFEKMPFCIARLDKLARDEALQRRLAQSDFDLIVVDEAHKMSATVFGRQVNYTKRYQLGRLLSQRSSNFLLLTATPHNGKAKDFELFMALIDPDRFAGAERSTEKAVDVSGFMRRLVKEELLTFEGTPLFPERRAYTVKYKLSEQETELYEAVTSYVREEFNRADRLSGKRRTAVGFALTILQRRLASSPEAIYQSLKRRRERLEQRMNEAQDPRLQDLHFVDEDFDQEDYLAEELERKESQWVDEASTAETIEELEAEIAILRTIEAKAHQVLLSGEDRKWAELSRLLQEHREMRDPEGGPKKLIVFTEHTDTLRYLTDRIQCLLGRADAVVTIHGGVPRAQRRVIEDRFRQDKKTRILVATDAAGEGLNLQRAHLMVNYDLPWNPNRLEQRFGRIHRIGQREVCHLWNLVASETREGQVYARLLEKLEQERKDLGGKVFEVLGKIHFENRSLQELLVEAVRYGNDPEVRQRLEASVQKSLDHEELARIMAEQALGLSPIDSAEVEAIREDMERMEAQRLQPYFIAQFFLQSFENLKGRIERREKGRYEILRVPERIRRLGRYPGQILDRYERVCFDKEAMLLEGKMEAELLCLGHPLLEACLQACLSDSKGLLLQGSILIDALDEGQELRFLCYLEDQVQDGRILDNGQRQVVSKRLHFLEKKAGKMQSAGLAPYLDYRAPSKEERPLLLAMLQELPQAEDLEAEAMAHALRELCPEHLARVQAQRLPRLRKLHDQIKKRMVDEIQYWDYKAIEHAQKEGKDQDKQNEAKAKKRAEELHTRWQTRQALLEKDMQLTSCPPSLVGVALIVPQGLLDLKQGKKLSEESQAHALEKKAIEEAAMARVFQIEKALGFEAMDVSHKNLGYDIESRIPEGHPARKEGRRLRFIEVKGRRKDSSKVTVTRNEILCALNTPEDYILAIVEIDGDESECHYLKEPFKTRPEDATESINCNRKKLIADAICIHHSKGVRDVL